MDSSLEILKKANLKVTPIRKKVLHIFTAHTYALDSREIESHFQELDRITLYRTLKSFEEKGVIHKITDLSGISKYAMCESVCVENHHHQHTHIHFQCEICNNIFCVEDVEIPIITLPKKYITTGQNITITGKCESCHQL